MTNQHHKGKCRGGPYNGEYRDYFKPEMPVLAQDPRQYGKYVFVPKVEETSEGYWFWDPLSKG